VLVCWLAAVCSVMAAGAAKFEEESNLSARRAIAMAANNDCQDNSRICPRVRLRKARARVHEWNQYGSENLLQICSALATPRRPTTTDPHPLDGTTAHY
jgi:hypothetical protein